jgi:ABC-2 type transport system permease protein
VVVSALPAAFRADVVKLLTARPVLMATGGALALHLLISWANLGPNLTAVRQIAPDGTIELFEGEHRPAAQALADLLTSSSLQIVVLFLPVIAAVLAGQEFRPGQLGTSVLAVPRRGVLMAAKTLVCAGWTLIVTLLVEVISGLFMHLAVRDRVPGLLLRSDVLADEAKLLALAALIAVVGFALTTLVRSTLLAIVSLMVLMVVTMTQVLARAIPALDALLPVSAGRNLLLDPRENALSSGPLVASVVLVAWALVSTLAAGYVLSTRDAR